MNSIDANSNGLYYNAAQAAANQAAAQAQAQKERKAENSKPVKKSAFTSMVPRQPAENLLASQGLPPEIAGLDDEAAFVWLKDQLDMAGDSLSQNSTAEEFENYKKAVSQFVKFIQKTNFVVDKHERLVRSGGVKKKERMELVQTIDKKLEQLHYDIWFNHLSKLKLLEKIHEINGLVVDLTAA